MIHTLPPDPPPAAMKSRLYLSNDDEPGLESNHFGWYKWLVPYVYTDNGVGVAPFAESKPSITANSGEGSPSATILPSTASCVDATRRIDPPPEPAIVVHVVDGMVTAFAPALPQLTGWVTLPYVMPPAGCVSHVELLLSDEG